MAKEKSLHLPGIEILLFGLDFKFASFLYFSVSVTILAAAPAAVWMNLTVEVVVVVVFCFCMRVKISKYWRNRLITLLFHQNSFICNEEMSTIMCNNTGWTLRPTVLLK